jgi:hypothetical protein
MGMMRTVSKAAILAGIWVAASLQAQADRTIEIVQELPDLSHVDLGAEGQSHGDLLAFEAPFRTEDGETGIMSGMLVTVDLETRRNVATGDANGVFHDRFAHIVVDFGGAGSLVVAGLSHYGAQATEMTSDVPRLRAVIGGTGRFIGARGQMSTLRKDTGHYLHTITLVD